jgi:hypothetical protein
MARVKSAISLGVSALIIIAIILIVGFGLFLSTTLNITSTRSTSTHLPSASAICLYPIPANATVTIFGNSSSVGNFVLFTNGTSIFFPLDACPQPATPELYSVASVIEQSASFIAAEGGSNFAVSQGIAGSYQDGVTSAVVIFTHYGNEPYQPCGASNGWDLTELGQLQVSVPEQTNGAYYFSNMTIFTVPSGELNIFNCPMMTTQSG